MPDDASGDSPGSAPSDRDQGRGDGDPSTIAADSASDDNANAFSVNFEHVHGFDPSPWAPLFAMLDSTESEESPDDLPFTPAEGVEGAHALELRAESMLQYAERGAVRIGALDRTEVGFSDDNRDVVAGRDEVEIDGMLEEHTGHGLAHVADEVELNVAGPLRVQAHLEDNVIMAGVMTDEWSGGTLITAAMSDDMAAGVGLRCTAPLDVWVHGLMGMEERPGTCAADGILCELAGTLYEREYGPSAHVALVARHSGTVVTTMKTGFRPLMKVALGVRNLIPGGGGGGGSASASPPVAPPAGGEAGAAALSAVEGGGALGRGAIGGGDTDEIVSVVRTVESASDGAVVEEVQHPASTADNLDALARADAEGTGYRQVAEIYDQPVPAAVSEPNPSPVAGRASGTADRGPPLDLTEPGTEGYDFKQAYGSLNERNKFYRRDSNWRGNVFMREYLGKINAKAVELLAGLGGKAQDVSIDGSGLRVSGIYAALEAMAEEAEIAGDVERLAEVRAAIDNLERLVNDTLLEVAPRIDEFSGATLGSQRVSIDPNIDTDKLRNWLVEQSQRVDAQFIKAEAIADPVARGRVAQDLSWEAAYWAQMTSALDEGANPLANSSEQIVLIRVEKVEPEYAGHADGAATAAQGQGRVVPPSEDEYQLELYLELQDRLVATLSDPEFFRSDDTFTPFVRTRIDEGLDYLGPDSLRPLAGGVDEPDVTPLLGPEVQPPDPRPGADSPGSGSFSRDPPALDRTSPGAEGYDFQKAFASLEGRKLFYREEMNLRGNFFTRAYVRSIESKASELFEELGGSADRMAGGSFNYRTSNIYLALEEMAEQAQWSGDVNRAGDVRAAMDELESMVDSTLAEVAARTDEFSGAALGSQHAPIDVNIDTEKLRSWLDDHRREAEARHHAAETPEARKLGAWEWGYYEQMIQSLDAGMNPLAYSSDQVAVLRIDAADPNNQQSMAEVDVYLGLHELLIATLSDPAFHRNAEEMGADAFTVPVLSRIEAGLDYLGPDSLRPGAGGEVLPPLPAADFADSAGYVDEVRDRSFSRSTLAASEGTLERQAASVAEGGASVRSRTPEPGSPTREPSLGTRSAPPDNAQAPNIDERSGRWVVEPSRETDATSSASDVLWESGLVVSDDSEVDAAAGASGDADTSNLIKAAPEPVDDAPAGAALPITPDTLDPASTGTPRTLPGTGTTPPRASAMDAHVRSDLYNEPVSFEGRSLEGGPRSGDPKELAQVLDGAEIPVEDLSARRARRRRSREAADSREPRWRVCFRLLQGSARSGAPSASRVGRGRLEPVRPGHRHCGLCGPKRP